MLTLAKASDHNSGHAVLRKQILRKELTRNTPQCAAGWRRKTNVLEDLVDYVVDVHRPNANDPVDVARRPAGQILGADPLLRVALYHGSCHSFGLNARDRSTS